MTEGASEKWWEMAEMCAEERGAKEGDHGVWSQERERGRRRGRWGGGRRGLCGGSLFVRKGRGRRGWVSCWTWW